MSARVLIETHKGVPIYRNPWEKRFHYDFYPIYRLSGNALGKRFGSTVWTEETLDGVRSDIDRCLAKNGLTELVPREPKHFGDDATLISARRILVEIGFSDAASLARSLAADFVTRSVTDGIAWHRWVVSVGPGMILFTHRGPEDDRIPTDPHDASLIDCAVLFLNASPDDVAVADTERRMEEMFGCGFAPSGWRWLVKTGGV